MKIPLLNFEMEKNPQFVGNCFIKKGRCLDGCKKYGILFSLNGFLLRVFRVEFFN
jgi:hypothetical protein